MSNVAKIEEMERLLREAQVEKQRLLEHRVLSRIEAKHRAQKRMCAWLTMGAIYTLSIVQEREMEIRRQALEDERRRREELEKRLQEETNRRQRLVETEMKLREKQRSQVFTRSHSHKCLNKAEFCP